MENTLFNQHRLNKFAKDKDFKLNISKHDLIKKHVDKLEKNELKAETSNYLYFFEVFLRDILGYDREENVLFDEPVDKGAKRSEFVLKNGDEKFMIVELKGQNADLDKPQQGHGGKTPVEQAYDYSLKTRSANWIMVSNYDEFRLYNWQRKDDYISFKAEELLDKEKFRQFMVTFSKKSHIEEEYADNLLEKSELIEKDIEKDFYKLYHETRLMIIKELEDINGFDTVKAVHYAQTILNRYMFICFAEDINNMLPFEISVKTIRIPIEQNNIGRRTIWNRLNELFSFINEGNPYKHINRFNGGLFKEDLSFITIRDTVDDPNYFKEQRQEWDLKEYSARITAMMGKYGKKINPIYWNLLTISSVNFESDLDVNILGHIFENSIGDLEDLKEGSKGRRKKDGIFYTPAYITEYICKNTIIPYLSKSGKATEVKNLVNEYFGSEIHELDKKVKKIRIVDPACGSGAFLNKAADILVEIHEAIHKKMYKDDPGLGKFFDNISERRKILKRNIYGVDLNEESVEITKLAMFLKVAQKDAALPDLNKNIKCGNSLIDDPQYAGEKAFNWEKAFPEIFKEGGFDIVIGNPPYVRMEKFKDIKPYLKSNYNTFSGRADLYVYFFEKGIEILREEGLLSFICSNKFVRSKYGMNLRKLILNNKFVEFIDYTGSKIFEDATVHPCTLIIKKTLPQLIDTDVLINNSFKISQNSLSYEDWSFEKPKITNLRNKIYEKSIKIKEIDGLNIFYGVKTGFMNAFIINQTVRDKLLKKDRQSTRLIKPFVKGRHIKKWSINYKNLYIIVIEHGKGKFLKEEYPAIYSHLKQYEGQLSNRGQVKNKQHNWLELDNNPSKEYLNEFEKEKIIWAEIAPKARFTVDTNNFFCETSSFIMNQPKFYNLRYLAALLNSKLLFWIFKQISPQIEGKRLRYKKQYVEKLPVYPATPEQQAPLIEKADLMLQLNKDLQEEVNSFQGWLQRTFKIEKLSKKLEKYYKLNFEDFLKEVKKKKVDVKSRKTQELLENEFNESLAVINPLLQKIEETDREIDEMVYDLYGLTDEEREIVEKSLK